MAQKSKYKLCTLGKCWRARDTHLHSKQSCYLRKAFRKTNVVLADGVAKTEPPGIMRQRRLTVSAPHVLQALFECCGVWETVGTYRISLQISFSYFFLWRTRQQQKSTMAMMMRKRRTTMTATAMMPGVLGAGEGREAGEREGGIKTVRAASGAQLWWCFQVHSKH